MRPACLALVLLLAALSSRAAEAPRSPWPGDARANLELPDAAWSRAMEGVHQPGLGFTSDELANYGRDAFLTHAISVLFHDVRAIPRFSGKLTDDLLAAALDPSETVRIGWTLSDSVAGRMLPRPSGASWGVSWLPDGTSPADALPKLLAHLAPDLRLSSEQSKSWAMLPEPVQRLVVRALVGAAESDKWFRLAFDDAFLASACGVKSPAELTPDSLYKLASAPWGDDSADQTATLSRASFELLRKVDKDYLAYGSVVDLVHLSAGLAEYRAWAAKGTVVTIPFPGLSIGTPLGAIEILGTGRDRVEGDPALLIVDLGGDDTYLGRQATPVHPRMTTSTIIDLGGNDRYDSGDTAGSMGCGLFGLGAIVDMAGDDSYACKESGIGCGWYGTGLVQDEAGNDTYVVKTMWGDGAAHVGVGLVTDLAGNDRHECGQQAQAMGSTLGAGILLDLAGNDSYVARDDGNVEAIYLNQSVAMAQGCGFGRRADIGDGHSLAGGFGVLVDAAGDDRYHAQVWAQGAAYWWSVGILEDRAGNDTYENGKYSSGAGAHFGIGCHVDLAGDDIYNVGSTTAVDQYQGHARDGSIGIFIDGDGDDHYLLRSHCAGAGDLCGIGFFWDRRGDDVYEVRPTELGAPNGWNETPQMGAATTGDPQRSFRDDLPTTGIFMDTGGNDTYPAGGDAAQDHAWTRHPGPRSWGFGTDVQWYPARK